MIITFSATQMKLGSLQITRIDDKIIIVTEVKYLNVRVGVGTKIEL